VLTNQLEQVRVFTKVASSGVSDTNDPTEMADFASRNEDRLSTERVPMLDPAWLMRLPKGQAFALLEGGRLVKLRIPLPLPQPSSAVDAATGGAAIPTSWAEMLAQMRASYDSYLQRTPDGPLTVEGTGGGF